MAVGELPIGISEERTVPNERFHNAGEIQEVCNAMVLADKRRMPLRASIEGLIDGNPVYSMALLKSKNQGWRARVNYREAEGLLQARQTPFYDLVCEVNPCVQISLDYGKGVDQTDWADSIARNFHWLLMKRWRSSLNYHIPLSQLEMLKHGIGYHVWPGAKNNWIPRTPRTGSVLFPDGVSANIEEDLEYFMLRDFVPAHVLYGFIKNENAARNLGWNIDSVWSALAQSSKIQQRGNDRYSAEIFQREMKSGDIGTTVSRQSGLWLNHLFVKQFDTEKISHYTVAEGITVNAPKNNRKDDPFRNCLFRKLNRLDKWPLVLFNFDIGNGDLHSIRGLGTRTKDFFELSNRVKNAMADNVLISMYPQFKQNTQVDPDKLRLMRVGAMTVYPQGVEPQILNFPPLNNGPIALSRELKATLSDNNESYMNDTPEPKDRETAQSFTMRAQDSAQVAKGTHSLYSSNLCQLYDRKLRILARPDAVMGDSYSARLAKEFRKRCEKDGVPDEAFDHIEEVSEVTSTGAGSASARIQALMTIMQYIYPVTDETRKINIERDLVSTLVTSSKTDRYARSHDDNELPDSDTSLAVQENNGMAQGGDAEMAPRQNHVEHLTQHLQKAQEIVQAVDQGQMEPAQALAIIQKFGQHCAQHLQQLQGNPMRKQEFEQLHQEWLALSNIADQLQQQVDEQQGSQPPQEKISDNLKIGLAKVKANAQLGEQKFQHKAKLDEAKFQTTTALKFREAAVNHRLLAAKSVSDNRRNGSKAA